MRAPYLFAVLFLAGCAHESAEERQIASLRDEMSRMQADRDRLDSRVQELEVKADDNGAAKPPPAPSSGDTPTPKLRVVRLNPDGTEQVEEATTAEEAEEADRPTIRVQGAPSRFGGRAGAGGDDDSRPRGQRPSAVDPEARRAYESALGLVNQRQYDRALDALAAFMVKYPDHPYVENATFWRGECYFAKGEYARAAEQFEGVVARFSSGNKAPDALLKLALCQQKLGDADKARATVDRLKKEYPRSDAARRAPAL